MANWNLYDLFRREVLEQSTAIVLESNAIHCAIVTGTYTPNQNTHKFWSDASANEVSGTGYTAGGNVCATGVISMTVGGLIMFDAADPATWAQNAAGFSNGRRAVLYYKRGGAGTADELIAYSDDFGADQGNVAGDFSVQLDGTNGIFTSPR